MSKILIVEDHPAIGNIEALICKEMGHDVEIATQGTTALTKYQEYHPDLVILDLMLPGQFSGKHVLEEVRVKYEKNTPFLIITALSASLQEEEISKMGNVKILAKPFRVQEITAWITHLLKNVS
jgi:DNA-binding response OmpR family regulator